MTSPAPEMNEAEEDAVLAGMALEALAAHRPEDSVPWERVAGE